MILDRKIIKIHEFVCYLRKKLTKFPNFTRFLPENARTLHNNCQKNIFPEFLGARAPSPPPSPTHMGKILLLLPPQLIIECNRECNSRQSPKHACK